MKYRDMFKLDLFFLNQVVKKKMTTTGLYPTYVLKNFMPDRPGS